MGDTIVQKYEDLFMKTANSNNVEVQSLNHVFFIYFFLIIWKQPHFLMLFNFDSLQYNKHFENSAPEQ